MASRIVRFVLLSAAFIGASPCRSVAEEAAVTESAAATTSTPAQADAKRSRGKGSAEGKPSGAQPKPDAKPAGEKTPDKASSEKDGKDDKEKKEAKSGPKPIVRSTDPPAPGSSDELRLEPDQDGKMAFQFRGQKWPDVLEWLADWSSMSLDWQELPGDYLNVTTRRKYTAREARDLINRHLLARGYTMLIQGEVLSVVNIKKIDPGMVPRVTPLELADRDPHEFVKISFSLDWLVANRAAEELKPMLSPNGKLTALLATNRLEAMDSVANLRQIATLLTEEQSGDGQERLIGKFPLRHSRAEDVREQLMQLLGIESKQSSRPMTPQQMQQQMQIEQMRSQQQKKGAVPPKPKANVFLVAVPRENSILAHAPPDKMAIIEEAIRAIDVPADRANLYRQNVDRMNIYRLATIDPEPLVKTLEEIGNLDFNTRLEVDKKNKAIIAYASLADHVTIRALIEKLDGSARTFHVRQLRRLEADYVAGTIQYMMGGGREKQPQRRRRYFYSFDSSRESSSSEPEDQFSVDADIVNNRLLLRANEDELRQVEDLLIKLGEIPSRTGDPSTVRMIEAPEGAATDAWLERIQRAWDGPNRLELDLPKESPDGQSNPPKASGRRPIVTPPRDTATGVHPDREARGLAALNSGSPPLASHDGARRSSPFRLVQLEGKSLPDAAPAGNAVNDSGGRIRENSDSTANGPNSYEFGYRLNLVSSPQKSRSPRCPAGDPGAEPDSAAAAVAEQSRPAEQTKNAPPIKVSRGPDGRLVIACEDPRALDRIEDLMLHFPPPRKEYEVFKLKYAAASLVAMTLEDYFRDDDKKERSRRPYWYWYDGGDDDSQKDNLSRLSRRRPVKFIWDSDTNSILVQNATSAQLRTIKDLIAFYDQPEPPNSQSVRKMEVIKLRYSTAEVVAEAVKEVFIDLLSSNDKARQKNQKDEKKTERIYYYDYYDSSSKGQKQMIPKFKGLLSIGIDRLSNSLVVSAPEFVMVPVVHMIRELDISARPTTTVEVVNVGRGVNPAELQRLLSKMMGEAPGREKGDRSKKSAKSPGAEANGQKAVSGQATDAGS